MEVERRFSTIFSRSTCICLTLVALLTNQAAAEPVEQLQAHNVDHLLASHEIAFVNFYADWCRFSQILAPVFEETSKKIKEKYPDSGKVIFGKVDCDKENSIATKFHISKYPTLKLFRYGQAVKKEFRGQRSVEALSQFVQEQLEDAINIHDQLTEVDQLEEKKRNVMGYFEGKMTTNYKTFQRVASQLRDDCKFHAVLGEAASREREPNGDKVAFRPPMTRHEDTTYTADLGIYDDLLAWAQDKCVPLVREITFENAEELTEEGLPFLILFHKVDDRDVVEKFTKAVSEQLLSEKQNVNFLTADGTKFSHPLHHLGKSAADLPVLAIDSFRHMYLFKHDVRKDLETPGLLAQFVADLHSGKLHREFHHGPDPNQPQAVPGDADAIGPVPPLTGTGEQTSTPYPIPPLMGQIQQVQMHIPHDPSNKPKEPTSPPESSFKKLAPSDNRYTIIRQRDEL